MNSPDIKIDSINDFTRLIHAGTVLDNSNADEFASLLMEMHSTDIKFVLIDMEQLEFLSSAGIGSILGTVELFREQGGDILMMNIGPKIHHVLDVLNLEDYLTICKDLSEARVRCGVGQE